LTNIIYENNLVLISRHKDHGIPNLRLKKIKIPVFKILVYKLQNITSQVGFGSLVVSHQTMS